MDRRRALSASAMSGGGSGNTDNYLTIVALEDGLTAKLSRNACEYCVNGDGNWKTLVANTTTFSINKGNTLSFRGNLTPASSLGIGTFTISKSCNLEGNCMSMLFEDDAANNISLIGKDYAFHRLFSDCTTIKSVSSSFLPATTLSTHCYSYMFNGCINLTKAPSLPAMTLASNCYAHMFDGSTNLSQAPSLLATILASDCYSSMFNGCTSLTTAPELPATILAEGCYSHMFYSCSKLTTGPELPATTLADSCYQSMFRNCTNLTTAPELPAIKLVKNCYYCMFYGCSKLNYIKAMFTTTPSTSYTSNWVNGVASTGKFIKNGNATWNVTGVHGIPSGWSIQSAAQ